MIETDRPVVLVVDDNPDEQRAAFPRGLDAPARFEVAHPSDVDESLLRDADLVLVDLRIDYWPARDNLAQVGLKPANGLALAAVLREHTNRPGRATGFALRSGHLVDLSVTPPGPPPQALARAHNLEWVFSKMPGVSPDPTPTQAAALARAVRTLPAAWFPADRAATDREVARLLALPVDAAWLPASTRDIANCRPPLTELAEQNHGLLFLRWLLQRILPYPCFLYDTYRLAARMRVSHASLIRGLNGPLATWLDGVAYRGILSDFLGPRWWRAGVEYLLWELGGEAAIPPAALRLRLGTVAGIELDPSPAGEQPVVCVDENYRPLAEAVRPQEAVRIQPDDWPSYASQSWTTVGLAREHERLRALVVEDEQDRVEREAAP